MARPDQLTFLGDRGVQRVYETGVARLLTDGGRPVEVDLEPFLAAGSLLYNGPWLAERLASVGTFLAEHPDEVHPVIRSVLAPGTAITGAEVFAGHSRLRALRRRVDRVWDEIDVLVLPTVPTTFPVERVLADPIRLNAELGRYTTFVNLLDLAAVAVPVGFAAGLPHGVTLIAPAGTDEILAELAADLHARAELPVGATRHPLAATGPAPAPSPVRAIPFTPTIPAAPATVAAPATPATVATSAGSAPAAGSASPPGSIRPVRPATPDHRTSGATPDGFIDLAVVGAHMTGLALNGELTRLGGRLLRTDRTRPYYRLYALPGPEPRRPGLLRVPVDGAVIEAEVWRLPLAAAGRFLLGVPSPLAIGTLELAGGRTLGFLCEAVAVRDAEDITHLGGWRRYLAESRPGSTPTRVP